MESISLFLVMLCFPLVLICMWLLLFVKKSMYLQLYVCSISIFSHHEFSFYSLSTDHHYDTFRWSIYKVIFICCHICYVSCHLIRSKQTKIPLVLWNRIYRVQPVHIFSEYPPYIRFSPNHTSNRYDLIFLDPRLSHL